MQDLGQGFFGDLRHVLSANRGYIQGGLVTGPLFGALGAWSKSRRLREKGLLAAANSSRPIYAASSSGRPKSGKSSGARNAVTFAICPPRNVSTSSAIGR